MRGKYFTFNIATENVKKQWQDSLWKAGEEKNLEYMSFTHVTSSGVKPHVHGLMVFGASDTYLSIKKLGSAICGPSYQEGMLQVSPIFKEILVKTMTYQWRQGPTVEYYRGPSKNLELHIENDAPLLVSDEENKSVQDVADVAETHYFHLTTKAPEKEMPLLDQIFQYIRLGLSNEEILKKNPGFTKVYSYHTTRIESFRKHLELETRRKPEHVSIIATSSRSRDGDKSIEEIIEDLQKEKTTEEEAEEQLEIFGWTTDPALKDSKCRHIFIKGETNTGKTSFVRALRDQYNHNIAYVSRARGGIWVAESETDADADFYVFDCEEEIPWPVIEKITDQTGLLAFGRFKTPIRVRKPNATVVILSNNDKKNTIDMQMRPSTVFWSRFKMLVLEDGDFLMNFVKANTELSMEEEAAMKQGVDDGAGSGTDSDVSTDSSDDEWDAPIVKRAKYEAAKEQRLAQMYQETEDYVAGLQDESEDSD